MSNLVEEAKEAANGIFLSWCKSTLRETACTLLKRKMMMKYEQQLKSITQEQEQGDVSNNNNNNPLQMNIDEEDIQDVYKSTTRIGNKWIEKLLKNGEDEFAKAVGHVCNKGKFLEEDDEVEQNLHQELDLNNIACQNKAPGWKNPCQIQRKKRRMNEEAENDSACSNNVLPGRTLSNGMHVPKATLLPEISSKSGCSPSPKMIPYPLLDDRRSEWVRNQIRLIDELATSGSSSCAWPYDWSIIQEAASNVTKRLDNGIQNYRNPKLEVIPKVLIEEETSNNFDASQNDSLIATSTSLSNLVNRKRRRGIKSSQKSCDADTNLSPDKDIYARPPCNKFKTGHAVFLWKDVKEEMEQLKDDDPDLRHYLTHEDDQIHHTIQGALKPIGAFHLWEQYKSDNTFQPKSINKIIKSGKVLTPIENKKIISRIQNKACSERLQLSSSKSSQKKVVGPSKKYSTKTERVFKLNEDDSNPDKKEEWMQFDVGECFLQLLRTNNDDVQNEDEREKKDWLAFRSIEVLLLD